MKWFIKRLLVICGTLSISCAAAVVLGRLDHSPSKLQTLGIDVCDGAPCFRGIRLGTTWKIARNLFPEGIMDQGYLKNINIDGMHYIWFHPSLDNTAVDEISILTEQVDISLPFNAKDIIVQFGIPCRVYLAARDGVPDQVIYLFYPRVVVSFDIVMNDTSRLQWNSPALNFVISNRPQANCNNGIAEDYGPWRGFRSAEEYRQHNLKDMSTVQPNAENP